MTGLRPVGPGIWAADGPVVIGAMGFVFPTRMALLRGPGGGLWLWPPVPPETGLVAAIRALGPVEALLSPSSLHHMALSDWRALCPGARLAAPPGLAPRRPDLRIDIPLAEGSDAVPGCDIRRVRSRLADEIVLHHRASRTVLVADLIQQIPPDTYRGWRALVARADRMTAPAPRMPRKFALAVPREARRALRGTIVDWAPRRLLLAHGPVHETGAAALLDRALR
ncbi:hypothetical protein [Wenxinia saemankumensis]|uniref:DUF4336 domain-containing protein n=1 Tax=Wenxinia saemankumensis TaxID=1447782 RepID=A0A1M6DZ15_9RHOB|nr:hypothetical protein [Wenxinia saemankumensis]SHI78395.1 hypothetical protein SAMN05444417_1690 [Wenxinia saemankumensis]